MKTVREAIKSITTFLSAQEINSEKQYRRISFCFIEDIDGTSVAYNSLTGEIIELNDAEAEILQKDSVIPCEATKTLIEKWFLVPTDHDDIQLCEEIRSLLLVLQNKSGIIGYTIFTTMDCNARCFYCFEMGRPRTPMSAETAIKTAEYIKQNCNGKEANISWFGGEPLCNTKVIDIITGILAESGVKFKSNFASNGYMFDQDMVDKAVEKWNLKHVQITLDGTQDVYNRAKAYVNSAGKNPFVTVTDNIERLLKKGVRVSIRMNMGAYNKEDLFKLVDWASERYKGYENVSMYPRLLFEVDESETIGDDARLSFAKDLISLENYCIEKNLFSLKGIAKNIKTFNCMADSPSTVTITPLGNLGKCEHFSEDEFVGTLKDGITEPRKVAEFSEKANSHELCKGCAAYPVCVELKKCPTNARAACNEGKRYINNVHIRRQLRYTYKKLTQDAEKES